MSISTELNVEFSQGDRALSWDIYRPEGDQKGLPVVIVLHGGGWRAGHREAMAAACTEFANRGYVAIASEYRLTGEALWPAQRDDVLAAIQAVSDQADTLGVDPQRLFLCGFSAGAHLALVAASVEPAKVAGIASFFPIGTRIVPALGQLLGISDEKEMKAASPLEQLSSLPPTIIFCGDKDDIAPPELSLELYQEMRKAGRTADLRLYSGLIHEFVFVPEMLSQTLGEAMLFFERTGIAKVEFDGKFKAHEKQWAQIVAAAEQ